MDNKFLPLLDKTTGEADRKKVSALIERLEKSPTAKPLLEKAVEEGYRINLMASLTCEGVSYPSQKIIGLKMFNDGDKQVHTLAHELRHVTQFSKGAEPDEKWNMKTQLMLTRAREADAQAFEVAISYELKQKGDEGVFASFEKTNKAIARSYARIAKNGHTGAALTSAFREWYRNANTKRMYDGILTDEYANHNWPSDKADAHTKDLTAKEVVEKVCSANNPNNTYLMAKPEMLETPDYLGVSKSTKEVMGEYFVNRKKKFGFESDKSVDAIPVDAAITSRGIIRFLPSTEGMKTQAKTEAKTGPSATASAKDSSKATTPATVHHLKQVTR